MVNKVVVLDTSLLVVWLQVPGFEAAGPAHDLWNYDCVEKLIRQNEQSGALLVLPLATIIETGNLICRSPKNSRKMFADKLADLIMLSAKGLSPWAIFTEQSVLWEPEQLITLATDWPALTSRKRCHSMGDATIAIVANYYAKMGYTVEIATGDTGLKQFQPTVIPPVSIPRRRQNIMT